VCASGIRQLFPSILLIGKSEMPVLGKNTQGCEFVFIPSPASNLPVLGNALNSDLFMCLVANINRWKMENPAL